MGVTVGTTRVAANTATGNQTISVDVGGLTPLAALFILSRGVTDATAADHAMFSYGATDGTRQWATATADEHNVADADNDAFIDDDHLILTLAPGDVTIDGSAAFVSFGADQVVINWDDAPPAAYLLTVVAFAGTDLDVYCDAVTAAAVQDAAFDVTGPGFEPDVVLTSISQNIASTDGSSTTQCTISLGVTHNNGAGTITQRGAIIQSQTGAAAQQVNSQLRSDYACPRIAANDTGVIGSFEVTSFDSSGFSFTARIGPVTRGIGYLALKFNGAVSSWVGTWSTPTSTGSDAETGPNFEPQFVLGLMTGVETINTNFSDSHAGLYGVTVMTAAAQYSTTIALEDAAATMNTQSLADDQAINLPAHDGAGLLAATFTSFDATGWTLNYSAVSAAAKLFGALAIGVNPPPAASILPLVACDMRNIADMGAMRG